MPNMHPAQIATAIGTMGLSLAAPGGGLYGGGHPGGGGGPHGQGLESILGQIAPGLIGQTGGGISPQYISNLASAQAHQSGTPGSSAQALGQLQQLYPGLFGGVQ